MIPGSDDFVVTGGRGFEVRLDSLEQAAAALSVSSASLSNAEYALYSMRLSAEAGSCGASSTAVQLDQESLRLEARARRAVDECLGAAASVRQAATAYANEESRRASAADGLQNLLIGSSAVPAFLRLLGAKGIGRDLDLSPESDGRTLARALRAREQGHIEGSPKDLLVGPRVQVAAGNGDPSTYSYALRSLRQAQGHEELDDGTTVPPSSILVERFTRADGSVAVMVTVPGTQTWALDSADGNLFDTEGILDGLASRESQTRALIQQALADQNLGENAEVVFNCYSQGGIQVFGLLEDEEFRARHRVAAVTAVGSPVSAFDLPAEVPVLSLTNADDIVPAASGRQVEPSGALVNVRSPSRFDPIAKAQYPQVVVAQAHDLGNYARDAATLDSSGSPAVLEHSGSIGAALGAGSAASRERFVYTGTDTRTNPGPKP
ncbi:hypothetical protein [Sinomonas gamaensis]|uniref:hypothetical protein n=1 Tax=Sinomonas gamaensis TaxID=2565624 RepID=UPI001107B9A2|nr:hypothetical protein [Sinomonas gamaensis]